MLFMYFILISLPRIIPVLFSVRYRTIIITGSTLIRLSSRPYYSSIVSVSSNTLRVGGL